jgi:hypothetical protein
MRVAIVQKRKRRPFEFRVSFKLLKNLWMQDVAVVLGNCLIGGRCYIA